MLAGLAVWRAAGPRGRRGAGADHGGTALHPEAEAGRAPRRLGLLRRAGRGRAAATRPGRPRASPARRRRAGGRPHARPDGAGLRQLDRRLRAPLRGAGLPPGLPGPPAPPACAHPGRLRRGRLQGPAALGGAPLDAALRLATTDSVKGCDNRHPHNQLYPV